MLGGFPCIEPGAGWCFVVVPGHAPGVIAAWKLGVPHQVLDGRAGVRAGAPFKLADALTPGYQVGLDAVNALSASSVFVAALMP